MNVKCGLLTPEIQAQSNLTPYGINGKQSGSALDLSSVIFFPMSVRIQLLICNLTRFLGPKKGLTRHHVFKMSLINSTLIYNPLLGLTKRKKYFIMWTLSTAWGLFFIRCTSQIRSIPGFRWLTVLNVCISRPTRCTNSYNESLLIIKRSTCFGLSSPSSGATFFEAVSQLV